jgi:hypothetical protein
MRARTLLGRADKLGSIRSKPKRGRAWRFIVVGVVVLFPAVSIPVTSVKIIAMTASTSACLLRRTMANAPTTNTAEIPAPIKIHVPLSLSLTVIACRSSSQLVAGPIPPHALLALTTRS